MRGIVLLLVRVIANTFFRRVDVAGRENVPASGPVIFAGNHPNALMDGWLLTAKCGRWPLHFVASAKLWKYPVLGRLLDFSGAVPVYQREEQGDDVDNSKAFEKLYDVIEDGNCIGVFPEGVSHVESQLATIKTGTARIALEVAARGRVEVSIVPCGLNYIHRHRFRSRVLIEFGEPIVIGEQWAAAFRQDARATVQKLTDLLAAALRGVTLNAPDWQTLRFAQTARRLYKPSSVELNPRQYIELNRRFVAGYLELAGHPDLEAFRHEVEDYQARLDLLGLRDHQLRRAISLPALTRRLIARSAMIVLLLPLAAPGALLHLPVAWVAATVGKRFSYEMDDVATLKVLATLVLLPLMYIAIAVWVGVEFGAWWALLTVILLTISFFASVKLFEVQASLIVSIVSLFRLVRLGREVEALREQRARLVERIRTLVDRLADPDMPRLFTAEDFGSG